MTRRQKINYLHDNRWRKRWGDHKYEDYETGTPMTFGAAVRYQIERDLVRGR